MGHMSSIDSNYTPTEKQLLMRVAHDSILHRLEQGRALIVDARAYPFALRKPRGAFVTLKLDNKLRGCIGTVEATRALVDDVAHNASAAAFSDPRFTPLTAAEFKYITIHIAVLNPPEAIMAASEADVLRQLRSGIDGLVLKEGRRRSTFLPSVWESLPDPRDFLRHLKLKAGLPENYWKETIKVQRYTTESIS